MISSASIALIWIITCVVFRDQHITPDQQISFSRRFGPLQIHVLHQFQLPGHPEVLIVSNIMENGKPIGLGDAGHFWHSDLSYKETAEPRFVAARAGVARGRRRHAVRQHASGMGYAARKRCATRWRGARAEHTYLAKYAELQKRSPWRPNLSAEQIAQVKPVVHPIVRTHPETGRKALFVSEHFTTRVIGLPEDESRDLLQASSHIAFATSISTGTYGAEPTSCSGTTAPSCISQPARPITCAERCIARRLKAIRRSERPHRPASNQVLNNTSSDFRCRFVLVSPSPAGTWRFPFVAALAHCGVRLVLRCHLFACRSHARPRRGHHPYRGAVRRGVSAAECRA